MFLIFMWKKDMKKFYINDIITSYATSFNDKRECEKIDLNISINLNSSFINQTTDVITFENNHNFKENYLVTFKYNSTLQLMNIEENIEYGIDIVSNNQIKLKKDTNIVNIGNYILYFTFHTLKKLNSIQEKQVILKINKNNNYITFKNSHNFSDNDEVTYDSNIYDNNIISELTKDQNYFVKKIDNLTIQLKNNLIDTNVINFSQTINFDIYYLSFNQPIIIYVDNLLLNQK